MKLNRKWWMYVVECSDGSLYTGITTDIDRRILEHNYGSKGAKYTRSRRPVKLLIQIEKPDHSSALKSEYKLKQLSRKKKLEFIKNINHAK